MARQRYLAPQRGDVPASRFDHPIYRGYGDFAEWMRAPQWPGCAAMTAAMQARHGRSAPRFVAQTAELLADGLHYEQRIAGGSIATREGNWHDLFNAMVWCTQRAIKQALNARQCAAIARHGTRHRDRGQYALTQFDEAGVIVQVRDAQVLAAWDAQAWPVLFHQYRDAWATGAITLVCVFGHALLEMALAPSLWPVGKALVVQGDASADTCLQRVAEAIADGDVLDDPQALRPLPLYGIPGWHPHTGDAAFYRTAPCFQPLRAGRRYPPPIMLPRRSAPRQ